MQHKRITKRAAVKGLYQRQGPNPNIVLEVSGINNNQPCNIFEINHIAGDAGKVVNQVSYLIYNEITKFKSVKEYFQSDSITWHVNLRFSFKLSSVAIYAIQVYERTAVTNFAQLMMYVKYE